ncbi:hypothetical protein [Amycolatopsis saalfeldensis]|uniref:Excreted virulence factor EspC, type VII ESX diderm n=1 Tax=Amycolatopsis saalfeldensis TaxID=394193 RepID=A0A1H8YNH3_9PSEU|nr:hypothetical protein [Amycolatopsis saalfeldensis]SEP53706.1 hypothetical protein SAMN04489732_1308 [Amycolatopsis saalfeldensis]
METDIGTTGMAAQEDPSTHTTTASAFGDAADNARASATQFTEKERNLRLQAGLLSDKPDMAEAQQRFSQEATAAGETADLRTGMAAGYDALGAVSRGKAS